MKTLEERVEILSKRVIEQDKLIEDMRDVLRLCARPDVGTYYQQESAKKMLLENIKLVWSNHNEDGTYTEEYKNWVLTNCGQKSLDGILKIEQELT